MTEIEDTHGELCELLHEEMDNIPKNVQEKIHGLVYKHFEP